VTSNGDRLVSEESIRQMFEPHQLSNPADFYPTVELTKPNWRSYGLAWFQQDFQGRKIDFHTGSLSGLIAIIGLDRTAGNAVVVLGNRDHAEMRHALLWEVMDNSAADKKRDWNQEIFDLYESRAAKGKEDWKKAQQNRIENTRPSLPLASYAGTYNSEPLGDILIVQSEHGLSLKTVRYEFEMSHWHLDSFLMEFANWDLHEFVTFNIGPDGRIASLSFWGNTLARVEQEGSEAPE